MKCLEWGFQPAAGIKSKAEKSLRQLLKLLIRDMLSTATEGS
jgi:hypothetical protein